MGCGLMAESLQALQIYPAKIRCVCYFLLERDLTSMNLVPAWTGRSGAKSSDRQWMKMGLKMTNMEMIYDKQWNRTDCLCTSQPLAGLAELAGAARLIRHRQ